MRHHGATLPARAVRSGRGVRGDDEFMSENLLIWIFGITWAVMGTCILAGAGFAFVISNKVSGMAVEIKFAGAAIDRVALEALKGLHSPTDHHGIDYFIDRCLAGKDDMQKWFWVAFKKELEMIVWKPEVDTVKKMMAIFLSEMCSKKLTGKKLIESTFKMKGV